MKIYPLTITEDRYTGVYSGGEYIAWRLDAYEVPEEPFMDDVTCMEFWDTFTGIVGRGDTPEAALKDLKNYFYKQAIEAQKEYGGQLSVWVEAFELHDEKESAAEWVRRYYANKGEYKF